MIGLEKNIGLFTDRYEISMAQGYFKSHKKNSKARFDYFFRHSPYGSGFVVFAGLSELLETLKHFGFADDEYYFLKKLGYDEDFLDYLKQFRFSGTIHSVAEGETVFPQEPVLSIQGNLIELQIIESLLLNILNFQSLIATKAARMRLASPACTLIDFGMRRAQGLGAVYASKAAFIGGFNSTSNLLAASRYKLPSSGTMAHSWVQAFDNELEAFRTFADCFPENTVLLIDTYNTLNSGLPNAIKLAREMEKKGKRLKGVRLDSGNLAKLSTKVREELDKNNLNYVKLVASNELDEYILKELTDQKVPIDVYGVGTSLVVGKDDSALDGVFKLSKINGRPTMKFSDDGSKSTLPGIKTIYRFSNKETGEFIADGIELESAELPNFLHLPDDSENEFSVGQYAAENLLKTVMKNGEIVHTMPDLSETASFVQERIRSLPDANKRLSGSEKYRVGWGVALQKLIDKFKEEL